MWCHRHACQPRQLQRALVVTGGRCGWKQYSLHSNTYLTLKIASIGPGSSCMLDCYWQCNLYLSKNRSCISKSHLEVDLLPPFLKICPHFSLSITPSFCCCQCEGGSVWWILQLAADAPIPTTTTKLILRSMSPSHYYLHICQHPLCTQEAKTQPLWCVTGKLRVC